MGGDGWAQAGDQDDMGARSRPRNPSDARRVISKSAGMTKGSRRFGGEGAVERIEEGNPSSGRALHGKFGRGPFSDRPFDERTEVIHGLHGLARQRWVKTRIAARGGGLIRADPFTIPEPVVFLRACSHKPLETANLR